MSKHGFRIRKRSTGPSAGVEINVTPMIDMFSVLNSFLLMTAVFSATGLIRVEVPFLSSKPPPPQEELNKNPEKVVTAMLDHEVVRLEIGETHSSAGTQKSEYKTDEDGLDAMQKKLYDLRLSDKRFDKVTVMTELDVKYEVLVKVLDAMRDLKPGRQPIPFPADYAFPTGVDHGALIPKIVLGNVIL